MVCLKCKFNIRTALPDESMIESSLKSKVLTFN